MSEDRYGNALAAAKARGKSSEALPEPVRKDIHPGDKQPPIPPSLRPETLEGMRGLAEEAKKTRSEKATPKSSSSEDKEDLFNEPFSYLELLRRMQREGQEKKRKYVEERISPMDIGDLLSRGRVEQDVPISDHVSATFRSSTGKEDLYIKNKISLEDERSSDMYMQAKLGLLVLTTGLVSINNRPLPDHVTEEGQIDNKIFEAKFERVLNIPTTLLQELAISHTWFQDRVQGLLTFGALKNG